MPTFRYSVARWSEIFETAETRKLESLKWVAVPNKHDGLGFRRVVAQRDRCELFAAWNLILQIASKGKKSERGQLARDGQYLTASDLALMTGFPENSFARALDFFSTQVQWLIAEECRDASSASSGPASDCAESPACPASSPALPGFSPAEGRKEDIEGNSCAKARPPSATAEREKEFERFWKAYPKKKAKGNAWKAWLKMKPNLEECLEAINRLRQSYDWTKEKGQFIPYPATWLNAEGWNDVPSVDVSRRQAKTFVPGESTPEPEQDPELWPEFTAEFPVYAGLKFAVLTEPQKDQFHAWAMPRLRDEWDTKRQALLPRKTEAA